MASTVVEPVVVSAACAAIARRSTRRLAFGISGSGRPVRSAHVYFATRGVTQSVRGSVHPFRVTSLAARRAAAARRAYLAFPELGAEAVHVQAGGIHAARLFRRVGEILVGGRNVPPGIAKLRRRTDG